MLIRELMEMAGPVDLESLNYKPTTKKALKYTKVADVNKANFEKMPKMCFAEITEAFTFSTMIGGEKETTNTTAVGDYMISGPSREKYSIKAAKFGKMYEVNGDTAVPEQSKRMVVEYTGAKDFEFDAPWGEKMLCKPGDYIVKEGPGKFYRIAKKEFEQTYNKL